MGIIDGFIERIQSLLSSVVNLLPDSPFVFLAKDSEITTVLGYVNYFIPFNFMLSVFVPWLAAIAIYYIYSIILRWAKAVGN